VRTIQIAEYRSRGSLNFTDTRQKKNDDETPSCRRVAILWNDDVDWQGHRI